MAHISPRETINLAEYDQLHALIRAYVDAHRAHARSSQDITLDATQLELIWDRLSAATSELTTYMLDMLPGEERDKLYRRDQAQRRARR